MTKMKKIFGGSAVAGGVLVSVLIVLIAVQPDDMRIMRSVQMAAPPERVFEQVNDYHKWNDWSPWAKLDPDAKYTFEGPDSGAGAKFSWSGNDKVGAGTQTILESKPHELIRIRLDFEKPMKDTNQVEFAFKPEGEGTLVTWTMLGKHNFMSKAMCLVMNFDKMIGSDFEKGLASIKAIVEKPVEAAPAPVVEVKKTTES
jgi:uncharacterized protein YndB with AHSA1/START domain